MESALGKYATIPLFFLLVISPIGMLATAGAIPSSVACTNSVAASKVVGANIPSTEEAARALTEASPMYLAAVKGYDVSFYGLGNVWDFNQSTCTVSWDSFGMNYLLKAGNGSEYLLTLGANPQTSAVFGAVIRPLAFHSLPISQTSYTYSGYAIAANGNYNSEVNYTATAWWNPTISAPSGNCGSNALSTPPSCELAVWTGLQNSTYDGYNHVTTGEVIQTGTDGNCYSSCSSSNNPSYSGWSTYLNGNSGGIKQSAGGSCPSSFSVSGGDEMYGEVGSQEVINGTTGNTFYTLLYDYATSKWCEFKYTTSTSCSGGLGDCRIAGKEYFADYFLETPQNPNEGGTPYMLPKFKLPSSIWTLFAGMYMTSSSTGTYPYYNDGYYLTSYMKNCASGGSPCTTNTAVTAMSEVSGSTSGYFNETWDSSQYTGTTS